MHGGFCDICQRLNEIHGKSREFSDAAQGTSAKKIHLRLNKTLHFLPAWPFSLIVNVVAKPFQGKNKGNSKLDLAKGPWEAIHAGSGLSVLRPWAAISLEAKVIHPAGLMSQCCPNVVPSLGAPGTFLDNLPHPEHMAGHKGDLKNAHKCVTAAELGRAFFRQRKKEPRKGERKALQKAICPLGFIPAAEPEQLVAPENF